MENMEDFAEVIFRKIDDHEHKTHMLSDVAEQMDEVIDKFISEVFPEVNGFFAKSMLSSMLFDRLTYRE
jgi:hypothetical protein